MFFVVLVGLVEDVFAFAWLISCCRVLVFCVLLFVVSICLRALFRCFVFVVSLFLSLFSLLLRFLASFFPCFYRFCVG